jgi:hypothetical protein
LIQVKLHSPTSAVQNSKAVGAPPTLDGFAFVPHVPLSWSGIHWVAELASEVMRQTSLSSPPSAQRRGTLSPTTEE